MHTKSLLRQAIRYATAAGAATWLVACASLPEEDQVSPLEQQRSVSTLAELESIDIDVAPAQIEDVSPESALESYRQAVNLFTNPEQKAASLRRMADLAMESAEKGDGNTLTEAPGVETQIDDAAAVDVEIDKMLFKSFMESAEASGSREEMIANLDLAASLVSGLAGEELSSSYATATKLYEQLLATTDDPAQRAEAYYLLAKAYDLNAELEKSIETLDKLVKEYPDSEYYLEAQFRRGEFLFSNNDFPFAAKAYKEVILKGQKTPFYNQSLYKHGWSLYKMDDYDLALVSFFTVMDRMYGRRSLSDRTADQAIVNDTQRAISLAFVNLDGAKSVRAWFSEHGKKEYEGEIYKALGDVYLAQERFRDAAETYEGFAAENPNHRMAPIFANSSIIAYVKGGFPSLVLPAKEQFARRFGILSPYWKNSTEEHRLSYREILKGHLNDLATHEHSIAQRTGKRDDYLKAAGWYREFIATDPKDETAVLKNHALAEALFAAREFKAATREFEKTAYEYKDYIRAADAAYFGLVAQQEYKREFKGSEKELQQLLDEKIASGLRFSRTFPEHEKAALVLYNIIEDQLAKPDVAGAVQTASVMISLDPPPEDRYLLHAWQTIANGEYDTGRYAVAEYAYKQVLQFPTVTKSDRATYEERLAASIYKQAEVLRDANLPARAAEEFLRVGTTVPSAGIRENADFDAAALYIAAEMWPETIATLTDFRTRYPKSKFGETIPDKLAIAYEKTGDFTAAAAEMVYIADRYAKTDTELARQALWSAAEMQDRANNPAKSIELYKKYVVDYPKPFDAVVEGQYRLVKLHEKTNDQPRVDYWLGEIMKSYQKSGGGNARITYLGAMASFRLSEPLYEEFAAVKIRQPLKRYLGIKRTAMDKAIKRYTEIAQMGAAEFATASNYKVGQIYQQLATDLMESERPKGMGDLELEEYEILLEEQALPLEDQAIDIYIANADLVKQGIYDQWVEKSYARLAELIPGRYAKYEQGETHVDAIY